MEINMENSSFAAETGFVSSSGNAVAVNGTAFQRVTMYCPPGIAALPVPGQRAVIFPCGGGTVCGGVQADTGGLMPGEVKLSSVGGAYIILKQNGEIELNGLRVSPDGTVLKKEGGKWIQK